MSEQLRVMISSTARDLPEHRQKVMDACMRLGMFYPDMMEHLTATDANALEVSVKIADRADLYIGVFAFRYGYVPDGQTISVTESEYNRACERNIPRLIFLMSDEHDIKPGDVETGDGAAKLTKLKERLKKERVIGVFASADDLKAQVIQALVPYRESNVTAFHYVSDIPAPPEEYVAHPYTLLQTDTLIGRQSELKLLTDWITGKELEFDGRKAAADSLRVMSVVAIGGMGKSALTWKWFNDIAPEEMKPLAGRMWWSFYESDATFENFVTRALAYITKRPLDEVQQAPAPEREAQLLAALNREPYLLVLDGLERILTAYARMDASRLDDSQVGKERNLRKTADPRVGSFLKKLAQVKKSRILVSSRLYPAELETDGGDQIPGSFKCIITGLTDDGAVELWGAFGVSGSRDELLPIFNTFGKHPLLIQALAGEVKQWRRSPGDFTAWQKANLEFDPSKFPKLNDAMGHVFEFALNGLDEKAHQALRVIAAFRMPAAYDTLAALLIGKKKNQCRNERELDTKLTELEDRGLIGWDKRANRYDLHPLVRTVVWQALTANTRRGLFSRLRAHFGTAHRSTYSIRSIEDLTPAIELYNALLGLKRYYEAYDLFSQSLEDAMNNLGASKLQIELLSPLVECEGDGLPRLENAQSLHGALTTLGRAFKKSGELRFALNVFCHAQFLSVSSPMLSGPYPWLVRDRALALLLAGQLFAAQRSTLDESLVETGTPDPNDLAMFAIVLAARGLKRDSDEIMNSALLLLEADMWSSHEIFVMWALGQSNLWFGQFDTVVLASLDPVVHGDYFAYYYVHPIWPKRVQGEAALGQEDFDAASVWLCDALTSARSVNLVEEELPALVALAELRRRQGDAKAARELLDDVWEAAERGPYPLFHADAFNVLAQIERDEGNTAAAIEAATKAYRLAWCDGPPFAYHWGLEKARQHLKELGAPEREMPPFDESKFEPMPDVEIDPDDEFHVGAETQP